MKAVGVRGSEKLAQNEPASTAELIAAKTGVIVTQARTLKQSHRAAAKS